MKTELMALSAVSLLMFGLTACDQKPKPEEQPTTATTGAAAPAEPVAPTDKAGTAANTDPAAAQRAAEDSEDIPTTVDFEEQAEQSITAANLEQELNTIEKEIGTK